MLEVKEQAVLLKESEKMMSLATIIRNGNIYLKDNTISLIVLVAWLPKGSPVKVRTAPVPLPLP